MKRAGSMLGIVAAIAIGASAAPAGAAEETPSAGTPATGEARDAAIRDAIEYEFRRDPLLEPLRVEMRVEDGHVVLYGHVDTEAESERAEEVASGVSEVRVVENHLRVGSGEGQLPIDGLQAPPAP